MARSKLTSTIAPTKPKSALKCDSDTGMAARFSQNSELCNRGGLRERRMQAAEAPRTNAAALKIHATGKHRSAKSHHAPFENAEQARLTIDSLARAPRPNRLSELKKDALTGQWPHQPPRHWMRDADAACGQCDNGTARRAALRAPGQPLSASDSDPGHAPMPLHLTRRTTTASTSPHALSRMPHRMACHLHAEAESLPPLSLRPRLPPKP